jgi:hypothetical protein
MVVACRLVVHVEHGCDDRSRFVDGSPIVTTAAAILAAFVVGYVLAWWGHREERTYLRDELRVAQAQIAHAVLVDRAVIPPRFEPVPEPEPLPSELQSIVQEWESLESRAVEEHKIRGWLAEGWGLKAIQRQYGVNG